MDGEPLTELGGEGLVLDAGRQRADWQDFEPPSSSSAQASARSSRSPFVLEGTAMVFEGAFMAELEDDSGRRGWSRCPCRRRPAAPSAATSARRWRSARRRTAGTLIVYDQSMEDGSRQDEVRIPVTFAP